MALVKEDEKGLFIQAGGYIARPGPIAGWMHAVKMDDGGLKKGDHVKARHKSGTPLNVITLKNNEKRYWGHDQEATDKLWSLSLNKVQL